jgi:uncharacterized protein YPO0396
MWITRDFSKFDKDVRILKKRLKTSGRVQVFEDYTRYAEVFRRKFGIEQEQALDLFQQTISMKKVEALTGFVRTNMLEVPNTADDVGKLINHFQDLSSAHEAVLKAKKQIEQLTPIVEQGNRCILLDNKQDLLDKARRALSSWFATQMVELLTAKVTEFEQELFLAAAALKQAEKIQNEIEKNIKETEKAIYKNGGDALETLKKEIENNKQILERICRDRSSYMNQVQKLKLPVPDSIDIFVMNRGKLPELKSAEEK